MDAACSAPGEPAPPMRFLWRKREYVVEQVLKKWRETGPCRNGSGERYVRKHWFEVRTVEGAQMKIFFERQSRSARERTRRWWLYTVRQRTE